MEKHTEQTRIEPLILTRDQTCKLVGLGVLSIWRLRRAGSFPRPIRLTGKKIGFYRDEVVEWARTRPRVVESNRKRSKSKKAAA
jgi:predicted DNA-binding transcriptional regulator AlpA